MLHSGKAIKILLVPLGSGRHGGERTQLSADRRSVRRRIVRVVVKGRSIWNWGPLHAGLGSDSMQSSCYKAFDLTLEVRRMRLPEDQNRGMDENNPSMHRQTQFSGVAPQSALRLLLPNLCISEQFRITPLSVRYIQSVAVRV